MNCILLVPCPIHFFAHLTFGFNDDDICKGYRWHRHRRLPPSFTACFLLNVVATPAVMNLVIPAAVTIGGKLSFDEARDDCCFFQANTCN